MNYKVLYRKYRPSNFDEIVGQEYIVETLKNSIKNNSISHAYIFSGPRGTGKTTTAKVFAKAINCLSPVDGSPCGKCEFCVHFSENPDIIELDAASNNGVDDIREIIDNIKFTPTNGKYKVYIIDEVHMLTPSAFNALLLTLEEPPAHSIFILATTNIENVPITILSRCQRYDFQKISVDKISECMQKICAKEKIDMEKNALMEISYYADGGMRDALSLLDQLSKGKDKITLEYVEDHIKIVSRKKIEDLFSCLEDNNVEGCLELIKEFRLGAFDYKTLVKRLIDFASIRAKKILIEHNQKRLTLQDYKKLILELVDSMNKVNVNVDSYTILEMILLDYFDNNILDKTIKLSNEVNKAENKPNESDVIVTKNPENDEELINIRINNCFYGAQKKYLEENKKKIEDLLNNADIPGKIKGILLDSSLVASSLTNFIFTTSNHNATNANGILEDIEKYLNEILNGEYKIIFISNERWNIEKNKYITNLKDKKEYKYIEEKEKIKDDKENIVNDVFDLSKVEII